MRILLREIPEFFKKNLEKKFKCIFVETNTLRVPKYKRYLSEGEQG